MSNISLYAQTYFAISCQLQNLSKNFEDFQIGGEIKKAPPGEGRLERVYGLAAVA